MAVTLKFLSRTPMAQHMVSASPKILAAATPKSMLGAATPKTPFTPARSPFSGCA
eukprot:CAMPEP_0183388108 /NCGR_PEP_ID=MMETSP0370-20130417/3812_1 /TAXON_ID=268820 /ORGANISM="Peridinium aciculiferum, Strain PAER-2" /LENGTH=54 /DNA_ID=CAMNT_0025566933 /DNA_START=30 /DNA_END=191 /DNA_ORIENTATION=+